MKRLALNMDSINGHLACNRCEEAFKIVDEIPARCPACKANLWGIAD